MVFFIYTKRKVSISKCNEGNGQIKTAEGTSLIKKGDHFILSLDLGDFEIKCN